MLSSFIKSLLFTLCFSIIVVPSQHATAAPFWEMTWYKWFALVGPTGYTFIAITFYEGHRRASRPDLNDHQYCEMTCEAKGYRRASQSNNDCPTCTFDACMKACL